MLLLAAVGVAGCSKRDQASSAKPAPGSAQTKPISTVAESRTDGEGFDANVAPKLTGSFADGRAAFEAKKYADATAIFESYIDRRPGNAWGYYMLGLSAWKNGDLAKSEKAFDQALGIDPHHVKSLVNVSRVFIEQKRYDDAIERLTRASEIDPQSAEVYRLLGRTYSAQGKTDDAVNAYRHAIELNERDAWSMNNMGLVLLDAMRADEALPLFVKAVEIRKDVPEFQNNLGMALEHTGRFKAAATAYNAALTANPNFDKAKMNLARVEAVKGGPEEPFTIAPESVTAGEDVKNPGDEKNASK